MIQKYNGFWKCSTHYMQTRIQQNEQTMYQTMNQNLAVVYEPNAFKKILEIICCKCTRAPKRKPEETFQVHENHQLSCDVMTAVLLNLSRVIKCFCDCYIFHYAWENQRETWGYFLLRILNLNLYSFLLCVYPEWYQICLPRTPWLRRR